MSLIYPSSKSLFESLRISKFRLISGIVIGLLYAFVFYAWLYVCRESLRIIPLMFDWNIYNYSFNVMSEEQVKFYNLFTAFISVILGQSICFVHWIDKPKQPFSRLKIKRLYIINDQRVFNWSFLNWFSRVSMIIGVLATIDLWNLIFLDQYRFFFYLLIIVLFLQTWNSIRLLFKQNSLKYMIISLLLISSLSIIYSKFNIVDYKALNHSLLNHNPYYKYNIRMAESNIYERLYKKSLVDDLYIVRDSISGRSKIIANNQEISFMDLSSYVFYLRNNTSEDLRNRLIWNLHIDQSTLMKFVNKLKVEMVKSDCLKIGYVVVPKKYKNSYRYSDLPSILVRLMPFYEYSVDSIFQEPGAPPPPPPYPFTFKELYQSNDYATFNINQFDKESYCVNETIVADSELKSTLRSFIKKNKNYVVHYYINDSDTYQEYISVLSMVNESINELRNDFSLFNYEKPFDDLSRDEKEPVQEKIPLRLLEITEDLLKTIN